jgi:hypothetical protein
MTSLLDELRTRAARLRGPRGYQEQEKPKAPPDIGTALKAEQYLLQDVRVIMDNGVGVVVPPLYHEVLTAKLTVPAERGALQKAQRRLEQALRRLDKEFPPSPAGLGVTVAWGLPYFRMYVSGPSFHYLPVDNRASTGTGEAVTAVRDAIKFPSDPDDVILEDNDVAILLRSDSPDHIAAGSTTLFKEDLDFWELTSIRKGFIGGGFDGEPGLPKQMAREAGIPGAELIPDGAELFMGFTSSQKAALGGDMIANFESIPGLTDQWPSGYFCHGTAMHLSHLYEDLEKWYTSFNYAERVARGFRPTLQDVPPGTQTISQSASRVGKDVDNVADLEKYNVIGHSAALQPATRLQTDLVDNYGNFYPEGTPVPNRADFNTLDNPFFWSANPERDGWSDKPAAGLHFVVFGPSSDAFHRGRLAMDGHYADGTVLKIDPRSPHQGMNWVLRTTHRQNFLVPPRVHRSFPLAEFL